MMVYKITEPDGRDWTAEMNEAGALLQASKGRTVTVVGLSRITARVNAVSTVVTLLASDAITDDEYVTATSLMIRYRITADDLNEAQGFR